LEGDILADHGELEAAVNVYKRVEEQGVDYLPEVINRICRCSREAGKLSELSSYLSQNLEHHGGITALLALADLMDQQNGRRAAIEFMSEHLRRHPSVRGLARLLELQQSEPDASDSEQLPMLRNLTAALLRNKSIYQCRKCGFSGKSLHWQCPSCKQWNTVKPIRGVEGE
jgi:lipopolysaccharide biosynthesis regulator YciM